MSAEFNVAGDGLTQANNVAASSDYVAMCWVRVTAGFTNPDYQTVFARLEGAYVSSDGIYVYEDGVGLFLQLDIYDGVTASFVEGPYITLNQWYHVCYTKRGSTHRLYVNGVLQGSTVRNISGNTYDTLYAGDDTFSVPGLEEQAFREWDQPLSSTVVTDAHAIVSEMNSETDEVKAADLITNTPLESDLLDDSGNGNDWSAVGSVAFVTNPPYPANSTAAGAIDLGTAPDSVVQDLSDGTITWDAWYSYTAVADGQLGLWGFGNLVDFSPSVTVWSPDGVTEFPEADFQVFGTNVPIQIPVETGVTYFFRFRTNDTNLTEAEITIAFELHDAQGIILGSIAINDDAPGFPLALLSPDVNNLVRQYINPFADGEAGDILDNGVVLVTAVDTLEWILYDATYVEIDRSAGGVTISTALGTVRQCRGTQRFWILLFVNPNVTVCYIEDDGTIGTAHVLGASTTIRANCIAANNDETILYYGVNAGANIGKIRSYNLLTDTIIGDFAAAISGYIISDILILSDDSIVAVYSNSTTADAKVLRYNAAGTILNTYEFGTDHNFPNGARPRIAYSLDDPNSFWIYEQLASEVGVSKFSEILISDGSVVRSVNHTIFEEGAYTGDPIEDPIRFGHSFSCPFWVATQGDAPPTTGTLIVIKESIPPSGAHEFIVDVGGGLSPAQLTMVDEDEETYVDVPVGTYSVVEQPDDDWNPTYEVSNDPGNDNLNISVGAGETVTVTITNRAETPGGGVYELTPSGPDGPTKPNDDFSNGDGSVTVRGIPPPFIITGFIRDA